MTSPDAERARAVLRDVRLLVVAGVAATAAFSPGFTLRGGAALVLVATLPDLVRYRVRAADVWAVAFAALTVLSAAWSINPELSLILGRDQVAVAALFVCLRATLFDRRAIVLIAAGYLAGCVWSLRLLLGGGAGGLSLGSDARLSIEGLNQNYVAYVLAGGVAVAVLLTRAWRAARLPALAVAAACFVGIRLTGSRSALLAVALVVVWWAAGRWTRRLGLRVVLMLLAATAVGIATGWTDRLMRSTIRATPGRERGDLNRRLTLWPEAREAFDDRPVLGWGAGSFSNLNVHGVHAHNVALDVATGLGIVGLVVLVGLFWTLLVSGTREADEPERSLLVGTVVCALAPAFLTGYWHQSPAAWIVLALFSQVAVLTASPERLGRAAARPTHRPRTARPRTAGADHNGGQ